MATRSSNGTDEPTSLPDHVVEGLLDDDHCRLALEILDDSSDPMIVEDLAAAILAREWDTTAVAVDEDDVQALRTELYEEHIPRLTAVGVVSYDSMLGTVELRRADILVTE
jgi:hypothetical protein